MNGVALLAALLADTGRAQPFGAASARGPLLGAPVDLYSEVCSRAGGVRYRAWAELAPELREAYGRAFLEARAIAAVNAGMPRERRKLLSMLLSRRTPYGTPVPPRDLQLNPARLSDEERALYRRMEKLADRLERLVASPDQLKGRLSINDA